MKKKLCLIEFKTPPNTGACISGPEFTYSATVM